MSELVGIDDPNGPNGPNGPNDLDDLDDLDDSLDIAVTGMACRFPGAGTVEAYRDLIRSGKSVISRFTDDQLASAAVPADERSRPSFVPFGGVLSDADRFDAAFFGYSPRDAAILDPQQRVFLECAWHALEDAGHSARSGPSPSGSTLTGVFAAASVSSYLLRHLLPDPERIADVNEHQLLLANDKDTLAARVAYHLDLRGPAVSVQTGCSSSLVAVHLAGQALISRDCDLALAGGVSVRPPQTEGYHFLQGGVLSPDGSCRPFDSAARGTVGGNGVGVVVLRRLADALRDGDTIHAVIRGSAVNNDGAARVGFTAPGVAGQTAVVRSAHQVADVTPDTIGYVEAHGTGTSLGDPIEVAALTDAFRVGAPEGRGWCALGSVKALIGHLDAAAGVAGLIKAVLAVRDGWIPGNPHVTEPDPRMKLPTSPFRLPRQAEDWPATGQPRRAGVSSFGMGGTNAHVVLEQPPDLPTRADQPVRPELLMLSAHTDAAVRAGAERLGAVLDLRPDLALADVAHTLRVGRVEFPHRAVVVSERTADAARALTSGSFTVGSVGGSAPDLVFLFPGQGAQHPGMTRRLYEQAPVFRKHLDTCADLLRPVLDRDLREVMWDTGPAAETRLNQTRYAQPALFAVEYALAALWRDWGVRPRSMVGHSVGEYVAACLAGTMELDEALTAVAVRGRLVQSLPPGAMMSVTLPADQAEEVAAAEPEIRLAATNAPDLSVLSGPGDAMDRLAAQLAEAGVGHRRLHTSHAFHSPMMDPVLDRFADALAGIKLRPPTVPFVAGCTGAWISGEQATDPGCWIRHLREPVRFSEGLRVALERAGGQVLLEVGPGTTLTVLAGRHDLATGGHTAIASLPHPHDPTPESSAVLATCGRLWTVGVPIDRRALSEGTPRRVSLSGYAFARDRHWIDLPTVGRPTDQPGVVAVSRDRTEPGTQTGRLVRSGAGPASATARRSGAGTTTVAVVAAIWAQLLGIPVVDGKDNFFALGGHSLLATQVLVRIRSELGVDLPPEALFSAPTVDELAAVIDRAGSGSGTSAEPEIEPVPTDADAHGSSDPDPVQEGPLSTAQERLWFLDRLDPGNPAYVIPFAVRLTGQLDHSALDLAVNEVVRRHDALRAVFPDRSGEPRQVVHTGVRLPLPVTDLRSLPAEEREAEARRLGTAHAGRRFDLATGPLIAVHLLRLDEDRHLLLACVHHIVFDGWSTSVFLAELTAHYRALTTGRSASAPDLPVAYLDWAAQDRAAASGPDAVAELAYWQRRLAGSPLMSTVPSDKPRPDRQRGHGAQHQFVVPAGITARLNDAARRMGTTLNVVALAGFVALLHRLGRQDDLLVGVPVAGRTGADLEPMIGCFANTLVLRVDVSGGPTARELVGRVHEAVAGGYAHQRAPYASVVEALAPPRDPGLNPLFQTMLSVAAIPEPAADAVGHAEGVAFDAESVWSGATDFDLFGTLTQRAGELEGVLGYDTDLYLPATVGWLADRFVAVLSDLAEHPDTAVGDLPALHRHGIVVAASFTADPVREPMELWGDMLRVPLAVRLAPYGQVLPHLLSGDTEDVTVVLVRWEDQLRHLDRPEPGEAETILDGAAGELVTAVRACRARSAVPLVIGLCPPSERYRQHPWVRIFARLDERLTVACRQLEDVTVVQPEAWTRRYPVTAALDQSADSLGHVPYLPDFFAALGTHLVRLLARRWMPPIDRVVVDSTVATAGAVSDRLSAQDRLGRRLTIAGSGADLIDAVALDVADSADPGRCLVLTADPATADRIRSRFPAVTTGRVPAGAAEAVGFLDHLWPLDPPASDRPVPAAGPLAPLDGDRLGYLAGRLRTARSIADRCRPVRRLAWTAEGPATAPRTDTERRIAALWSEFVPSATPDVRRDFFTAGGHSLLAVQLLSRIEADFARHVPLPAFLADPTVERLARFVEESAQRPDPIPVRSRDERLTLSSTQRRLWTIARLSDDPSRHDVTFAAVLRGPLQVPALRDSVAAIVRRHEILRTTFPDADGAPALVVHDRMDCWLPERDLTDLPEPERTGQIRAEIDRHAQAGGDLSNGPLLRVRLLTTGQDEHHLLIGMHHIVSDNWSWNVLLRELAAGYAARCAGEAPDLPELPIQFAGFAAWQAGRTNDIVERHADYWRSRLVEEPPLLDGVTDRPRPTIRSDRSDRAVRAFTGLAGPRLRDVAAVEGGTLFAAVLAGFAALLGHLSGRDAVVLGTPVTGRGRAELDGLIGYFADLLPLQVDLAGEPSLRELIRRCHTGTVAAYAHEMPFSDIVEAVRPTRDPGYHPIFQCIVNVVDDPATAPALAGVDLTTVEVPPSGTDFDLFLTVSWGASDATQGDCLHAALDYRVDLFEPQTADALLGALERLLAAAVREPDQPMCELDADHLPAGRPEGPAQAGPVLPVSVAASFTVEPMLRTTGFWLDRIGLPARLDTAPYGQVLQQLLDPDTDFGAQPHSVVAVLLRWEDWLRQRGDGGGGGGFAGAADTLNALVEETAAAVRAFRGRSSAPLVIAVCPASAAFARSPWSALFAGLSHRLAAGLAACPDVDLARFDVAIQRYGPAEIDDPVADDLGHVPYTAEAFAALGTLLAKEIHQRQRQQPALLPEEIVVDQAVFGLDRPEVLRLLHRQRHAGRRIVIGTEPTGAADGCVIVTADPVTQAEARARFPLARVVAVPADPRAVPWLLDDLWTGRPGGPDPVGGPTEALALAMAAAGAGQRRSGAGAAPRTARERALAEIWAELLHLDEVGVDQPFWALGGDSMVAIQVVSRAARAGIEISPRQLLENPTVEALAASVVPAGPDQGRGAGSGPAGSGPAGSGPQCGVAPLTGAQRWFFAELAPRLPRPAHFNHPYDLILRRPIAPRQLAEALTALAGHHGSLRLRFRGDGADQLQEYGPPGPFPFESHDLSPLPAAAQDERIVEIAAEHQAGLDIVDGPMSRAVHFTLGPDRPDRILIVNHHLVVDAMSRGVLLEDLETACDQVVAGQPVRLPARTTAYGHWARRVDDLVREGRFDAELEFWRRQEAPAAGVPVDHESRSTTFGTARTLSTALTVERSTAVRRAARALGCSLSDLLLTATAATIAHWTGGAECGLAVAGHGRPDVLPELDLSRTVGWFQVYYPLRIPVAAHGLDLVAAVRAKAAAVPYAGIGYGLLRYGHPDPRVREQLGIATHPQVSFNYMGDLSFAATPHRSARFDVSAEIAGSPQDVAGSWPYLLDVVPSTAEGRVHLDINYFPQVHRRETVDRLAADLVDRLAVFVREAAARGLTDPAEGNPRHAR